MNIQPGSRTPKRDWFFGHLPTVGTATLTVVSICFDIPFGVPWWGDVLLGLGGIIATALVNELHDLKIASRNVAIEMQKNREEMQEVLREVRDVREEGEKTEHRILQYIEEIPTLVPQKRGPRPCREFDNLYIARDLEKTLIGKADCHLRSLLVGVGDGLSLERGQFIAKRLQARRAAGVQPRYDLALMVRAVLSLDDRARINTYLQCFNDLSVRDLVSVKLIHQSVLVGLSYLLIDRCHEISWRGSDNGDLKDMRLFEGHPDTVGKTIEWFDRTFFHNRSAEPYDEGA